jgi:hypothetical protein
MNILNTRARILCNRNEKIINQKFVLLKVASDKSLVNISYSTESDFVHFPMGHCCLLLNEIKVSFKTVMYYFSTKSLSKYLTATFPTLHFLIASCF